MKKTRSKKSRDTVPLRYFIKNVCQVPASFLCCFSSFSDQSTGDFPQVKRVSWLPFIKDHIFCWKDFQQKAEFSMEATETACYDGCQKLDSVNRMKAYELFVEEIIHSQFCLLIILWPSMNYSEGLDKNIRAW